MRPDSEGGDMRAWIRACSLTLAALAGLALGAGGGAAQDDAKNRVSFGVERTREVENDWVTASIGVTLEDEDPARLADRINQAVAWGLEIAKGTEGVRVRTSGYHTFPVDDPKRGTLRRWRGGEDLLVEGGDSRVVSELLGRLQERLQLRGLNFSVSPRRRAAVEEELIEEALDAFRARAARIAGKLDAGGYQLVHVQIDAGGTPPPMPMHARALGMAEEAGAPPPLEGGTSILRVGAQGTIELE